ncbi:MAG: hypothetical protein HYV92_14530 [Candidatus Rokubacteria bacterium]|nr:hypothetical protein [Candidatus Rokubacteria bacterium]
MTTKEALLRKLEGLSASALEEVLAFVRVLEQEPEAVTQEEAAEIEGGRREVTEGQWTRWRDIKRTDV